MGLWMNSRRTLAAAVMASACGVASAVTLADPGPCGAETSFSPSADYSFTFRVCGSSLVGAITARASGWVAVGFSRDQYMPDTDVFMAGVRPDGSAYGFDAFAFLRNPPVIDARQDATLLSASEQGGVTSVSFTRPLFTGDAADFDLTDGEFHILAAFQATSDSLTVRHSFADASELTFRFAPVPEPSSAVLLAAGLGGLAGLRAAGAFVRGRRAMPAAR